MCVVVCKPNFVKDFCPRLPLDLDLDFVLGLGQAFQNLSYTLYLNIKGWSANIIFKLLKKLNNPKSFGTFFAILWDACLDWEIYSHPIWCKSQSFVIFSQTIRFFQMLGNSEKTLQIVEKSFSFAFHWMGIVYSIKKYISQNGKNSLKGYYILFWAL